MTWMLFMALVALLMVIILVKVVFTWSVLDGEEGKVLYFRRKLIY